MDETRAATPSTIGQTELDHALVRAMADANKVFENMSNLVTEKARTQTHLNVVETANEAGLPIDEATLAELQVDRIILVHRWLPWHYWWPWRPLWCWWWRRYYPWYRCCPYWWYRCHWYPW